MGAKSYFLGRNSASKELAINCSSPYSDIVPIRSGVAEYCGTQVTPLSVGAPKSYRKAFVQPRNTNSSDIIELQSSIYAIIERYHETYICLHDIIEFVSKKIGTTRAGIKWKHLDDRTFLCTMPDKFTKDKFAESHKCVMFGDAMVRFKSWMPAVGTVSKPCKLKVWLKLTGLPIEQFCFNAAEIVVSGFGRLHRCNMEKKKSFIGSFYCMMDCVDLDLIEPRVDLQTETGMEIPIFIDKEYAYSLEEYNGHKFDDNLTSYDEIISTFIDRNQLIAL